MMQMTLRTMCDIKTFCYILSETEEGISGRQKKSSSTECLVSRLVVLVVKSYYKLYDFPIYRIIFPIIYIW
jgi:hypothetical protein